MPSTVFLVQCLMTMALALPELKIHRQSHTEPDAFEPSTLERRRIKGTVATNPYNILAWSTGGAYYVNVTIGTPAQEQLVLLDTGSSDLYFEIAAATICEDCDICLGCRPGAFLNDSSTTYRTVDPASAFNGSFRDGDPARGLFALDTFGIGDITVDNVQFIALRSRYQMKSDWAVGSMGLGYGRRNSTLPQYPSLPQVLRDAKVIRSRLYSIYLDHLSTGSGSVLFGGIDTSKFKAPLVTVNMLPSPDSLETKPEIHDFITTVTDLDISVNGTSRNIFKAGTDSITAHKHETPALAVKFDTASPSWTVPLKTYELISNHLTYIDNTGRCACSHRYSGDTLTLTFASRLRITVPAQQFLVPIYSKKTRQPITYGHTGDNACAFMVSIDETDAPYLPLGASILTNMYVVFDLDNGQLSMAQAVINSTEASNIVTVAAGPDGVAFAVSSVLSAAKQTWSIAPQVSATQTYIAKTASSPVGTATGTNAVRTDARPVAASATTNSAAMSHAFEPHGKALSVILATSWIIFMVACGTALGS